jgi:phospholipase/lecithinase/hemolysin
MKNFAGSRTIGTNDVFLIDSGANDVRYALTLNPTDQQPYMQQQAGGLAKTIKALQLKGATHLIIANQPESFGNQTARDARRFYDAALRSSLASLGVAYVWGDRNRVRLDIVADPARFNMDHVANTPDQIACPGGPQAGFPSGWALLCGPSSPVITPTTFAQRALFADDGHWASNGQRVLGSYYYCLVRRNWPTVLAPAFPVPPRPPYACDVFSEFAQPPPL